MYDVSGRAHRGSNQPRRWRRALIAPLAMVLLVGACSSDDGDESAPVTDSVFDPANPEGTEPPVPGTEVQLDDDVIIATDDGVIPTPTTDPPLEPGSSDAPPLDVTPTTVAPVPLPAPSDVGRIVSMSATHTETLFALGLGEFVVAVDSSSDFPESALAVRRGDLDASSADLSVLLSLEPDVVIVGEDPTGLASRLSVAGVATYIGPPASTLDDVYNQIEDIAAIVGRPELGADLTASMRADVARIIESVPAGARSYFHEIDPSLVTIGRGTFLDSLYGQLGLTSIVSGGDEAGFAQLTPDQVISADPDVIMLADVDCCAVDADRVAARPGWGAIDAVDDGAIVLLPEDVVARWGPRVVDLLRLVAGGVASTG